MRYPGQGEPTNLKFLIALCKRDSIHLTLVDNN